MGRKPWSTEGKSNVCPSKPADHPLTQTPCSLYYCTKGMFQEVTQEGWLQRQIQEHRSTDQAVVFAALWVTTDCISWAPNHFVMQAFCAKKSEAHLEIWKMKSSGLLFQLPPERNKTLNNCLHRLHLLYLMCKISRASLKATIPEHVLGKEQKLVVNKQRDIIHQQICGESNKTCSEVQQSHRLLILLSTQPQINQSDNIHDKNVITCSKYLAWWQKRLRVLEGVMAANATVTNIYASSTNASLKYTHTRHRLKLCLTNQKPASSTCFIIQRSPGLTLSRHDMACVRIWRVVPLRRRRRSFPFSNSRVRLCSLCPSAWSSIPEFHRVLNFREMLSSAICLGLGLNLKRRLLRPSKLTTSESEEARKTHTLDKVHSCLCLSRHSEEDDTLTLTECRSATSLTPTVSLSNTKLKMSAVMRQLLDAMSLRLYCWRCCWKQHKRQITVKFTSPPLFSSDETKLKLVSEPTDKPAISIFKYSSLVSGFKLQCALVSVLHINGAVSS